MRGQKKCLEVAVKDPKGKETSLGWRDCKLVCDSKIICSLPLENATVSVPAENALMAMLLIDEGAAVPMSVKEPPGPSCGPG